MSSKSTPEPDQSVEPKAVPVEAAEPVQAVAISQLGSTFAERAKAREQVEKRVAKDSEDVEDKAVTKKAASSKSKAKG